MYVCNLNVVYVAAYQLPHKYQTPVMLRENRSLQVSRRLSAGTYDVTSPVTWRWVIVTRLLAQPRQSDSLFILKGHGSGIFQLHSCFEMHNAEVVCV